MQSVVVDGRFAIFKTVHKLPCNLPIDATKSQPEKCVLALTTKLELMSKLKLKLQTTVRISHL